MVVERSDGSPATERSDNTKMNTRTEDARVALTVVFDEDHRSLRQTVP
jgi:hypothetical protein